MTPTELLRARLDELGVEWWDIETNDKSQTLTECIIDDVRCKYRKVGRGFIVSTCTEGSVTPEQAVAATVGAGTCHFNVVINQDSSRRGRGNICECDKCGYRCARGFIEDERFKHCPNCGKRIKED